MNSDDITLRQESYGSLTTAGVPLTAKQFDDNNIAIYKDFESLAITLGVPAYDAGTTYNNDYNDNTTETFATYGNRFWQWVNISDGNSTPSADSDWVEIFPTMLAHEKNKDRSFDPSDGFLTYNTNQELTIGVTDYSLPSAKHQVINSGTIFTAGVENASVLGADYQAILYAFNPSTLASYGVRVTPTGLSLEYGSMKIVLEDGKIMFKTPEQVAGNLSNGDVLQFVDASTGEVEGTNVAALNRTGWASYVDTEYPDALNAFTLPALTETVLPNNAGTIIQDQMPSDVTAFYYGGKLDVGSIVGTFVQGETITGGTSGATATVLYVGVDFLAIRDITGTFAVSETITGGTSAATATVSAAEHDGTITGRSGDSLDVMIYFKAVPSAISQYLDIWIDITGGTGTPTNLANLYRQTFSFPKGAGVERGILYALPSGYTLSTWEANGGKVKIYSDAALDIYQINYNLDRSHKAI